MLKLLKYPMYLTIIFFTFQYFNNLKEVPSFVIPEMFSWKVFKRIPEITSINEPQQQSTADQVEKIQKNELQEIQTIWKQLGIKSELFKKNTPFLAESFTLPFASKGGSLYVFKITNNDTNDWQYLFFNIKNRSWNFYGYLDLPHQDSSEPISRKVSVNERNWLVITSKTDSPNLPGMYQDRWFDLNASKLREVLSYYVYQDQPRSDFIKRYSATILDTGIIAGTYFIDLNSKITYLNDLTSQPDLEAVFTLSHKVRYLWDDTNQLFKNHLQPQQDDLYRYGADEILSQNYLQIEDLATIGDSSQRNLVKVFLNLCSNSTKKRRVLQILR